MFSLFARHLAHKQVSVGARYQDGSSPLLVWEVANIFDGIDKMPYAQIFCLSDTSRRKTVAQSALQSGRQYTRIESQDVDQPEI